MGKIMNSLANGVGSIITRVMVTIFVAFAVFMGNQLSNDIRGKFDDIDDNIVGLRASISSLRNKIVGTEIYRRDWDAINQRLIKIEDKLSR